MVTGKPTILCANLYCSFHSSINYLKIVSCIAILKKINQKLIWLISPCKSILFLKSSLIIMGFWMIKLDFLTPQSQSLFSKLYLLLLLHITYSWFIMGLKSEGNCGLWIFDKIMIKICTESLKKIVGAVWEIPAK